MLIELPDAQAQSLQRYCRQTHISEAEALRQALTQFLPLPAGAKRRLRDHRGFGYWRERQQDGLAYQYRLRDEWSA